MGWFGVVRDRRCLLDPAFSRFGTVPACDDAACDRRTHDYTTVTTGGLTTTASSALAL